MKITIAALALCLVPAAAAPAQAAAPTFTKDVAPIVWNHCASCHHAGEVAPFTLTSYNDVKKRAKQIVKITRDRVMPPWKPEPGYGEFHGDRRLSDEQIRTIEAWAAAGAPEGDAGDLPPLPKFADGWLLGEPDVIVKLPQPYALRADGPDVFRCFVMPIDVPAGKFVRAVDFRPGNRKVTHHALTFLDTSGAARRLDDRDPEPGYAAMGGVGFLPSGGLGGWAPGAPPHQFPPDAAKRIAPNTDVVVQVHFHPSGKAEHEQFQLGVYLTDRAPTRALVTVPIGLRSSIDIPPGVKDYKWADSFTTPVPVEVPGLTPHAHYICRDMKVWATPPGGEKQWLLWIKDWDFDWQGQYRYKQPQKFPAGTKFEMEYTYDNSADNPRNPSNPPQRVRRGEQTTDEMGITFVQMMPASMADAQAIRQAMREKVVGGGVAELLKRRLGGAAGAATTRPAK
jgi:mono/diheme cytochrome c family protein